MIFTRRVFVRWSAFTSAVFGALPIFRHRLNAQTRPAVAPSARGLDVAKLLPLADVVLPGELGASRIERATAAFARWIAEYREGEETVHPYGSERLGTTGSSPATKWAQQLVDLTVAAGTRHSKEFRHLNAAERRALVDDALAKVPLTARIPSPESAPHVAIGLLAHFLASADARNLAYGRIIDPRTCRPLATSPREPVTIRRAGRAS